jgi:hypothetical protein
MSSFGGSIVALFVAGMVGGYAGLYLLGPTDETQSATLAAARVAEPPALPCSMQAWPNADRKCLEWTAPRGDATSANDGAQKATTGAATTGAASTVGAPSGTRATPATQPSTVGMSATRQAPAAAPQPIAEPAQDTAAAAPQAEPDATDTKARGAKSRTATSHARSKALANAYAFDGAPRSRSASRSSSERSFFDQRPRGWWW